MRQLEVLCDELGIPDRAFAQLDLAPGAAGQPQLRLGELLHRVHLGAHRLGPGFEQQRRGAAQESSPDRLIPGHDARAQQRLLLPEARVPFEIG